MTENKINRVTVAMIGARRHYAVPRILSEAGLLERFYTDSYIGNKPWLESILKVIPAQVRPRSVQRWLGRHDAALPPDKVASFDMLGLWYAWARYRACGKGNLEALYQDAAVRFNKRFIETGFDNCSLLWGFNGASLEMFTAAKARGICCILDQTSNPKSIELELMEEEYSRWCDWVPLPPAGNLAGILREREQQEWELADQIVVGSDFVASGLSKCGISCNKVRVVPSGIDLSRFSSKLICSRQKDAPLRVLFVGSVSLMKGVPYLLTALASLGAERVQARLIGAVSVDHRKLEPFQNVATVMGHIPRSEMPNQYQWADVFCFPSITEGSAAVTYEALASGLPVITTPNAGSIVQDGVDGFIVPIRDSDALADRIMSYYEDKALLERHQAATEESRKRVGLDRYRADLERLVQELSEF